MTGGPETPERFFIWSITNLPTFTCSTTNDTEGAPGLVSNLGLGVAHFSFSFSFHANQPASPFSWKLQLFDGRATESLTYQTTV